MQKSHFLLGLLYIAFTFVFAFISLYLSTFISVFVFLLVFVCTLVDGGVFWFCSRNVCIGGWARGEPCDTSKSICLTRHQYFELCLYLYLYLFLYLYRMMGRGKPCDTAKSIYTSHHQYFGFYHDLYLRLYGGWMSQKEVISS